MSEREREGGGGRERDRGRERQSKVGANNSWREREMSIERRRKG